MAGAKSSPSKGKASSSSNSGSGSAAPTSAIRYDNTKNDRILIEADHVNNKSFDAFPKSMEEFKEQLKVHIKLLTPLYMEMDIIGVDPAFVNTIRRFMMAEVPTMAIKTCYIYKNQSIVHDECLANRLGLVPIKADPSMFNFVPDGKEQPDSNESLLFRLKIDPANTKRETARSASNNNNITDPHEPRVYAKHMEWIPLGDQLIRVYNSKNLAQSEFAEFWLQQAREYAPIAKPTSPATLEQWRRRDLYDQEFNQQCDQLLNEPTARYGIRALYPDILLARLSPAEDLEVLCLVTKGVGKDHAKYSPVSASFYRTLPVVEILEPIRGADALLLQKCFSKGVIGLRKVKSEEGSSMVDEAYVVDARGDTVSREYYRHPQLAGKVRLSRVPNHFIFGIESIGQYHSPSDIFMTACKILYEKCNRYKTELSALMTATTNH